MEAQNRRHRPIGRKFDPRIDMNVMAPPLVAYHTWPTMAFQACHHVHLDGVDVRLGTEGRHCTQKLHPEFAGDRERDCYC